jgi:hypothetical protein
MFTVYLVCAAAGSTLLIIMFILTFMGMDGSGEGADAHFSGDEPAEALDMLDDFTEPHGDSTLFFHVLSIRSVIAAVAFFGLGGLLAETAGASPYVGYLSAMTGGVVAMFAVAWMMHLLYALRHDGSFRIGAVLGSPATVYLAVPGARSGVGKVTVAAQNRSVELDAMTDEESIATGSRVVVVEIVNENTVAVTRQKL